ncbi:MAG: winged helix-turn-helix domain-containing protein, partial [Syntrophobacteraceae bacterium]
KKANAPELLRMAQAVVIPSIFNVPDRTIGEIIGRSRPTVVRLRKKFREMCAGEEEQRRNWGGRRYGYMTVEDERKFLSQFLDKAEQGGILVVGEIKRAFEALVGKKVAKTTIYRMLDRHNWRTIVPRPRHPNSNTEAQEGFKKTPENGE